MQDLQTVLHEKLSGEYLETALQFVSFLEAEKVQLKKDQSIFWRDKTYYHVSYRDSFVCYLSVADPDDSAHSWTVWSVNTPSYETAELSDDLRETAWRYVDLCHFCGSCGGGRPRTVFGRRFDEVCGCTFRVDDAKMAELPFLREMVRLRKQDIDRKSLS